MKTCINGILRSMSRCSVNEMRLIKGQNFRKQRKGLVVAIGNFDGIHLGHRQVLKKAIEVAKEKRLVPAVLTFEPHPVKVLNPAKNLKLIYPPSKKYELIASTGINLIVVLPFSLKFAKTSSEKFAEKIVRDRLGAKFVVVGHNFRFGFGGKGDAENLRSVGKKLGFDVIQVPPRVLEGEVVSSSHIRRMIASGQVERAARFLGRPFSISGKVVRGHRIGKRLLGIPTVNVVAEEIIPASGVYVSGVIHDGKFYQAAGNVGGAPTFGFNESVVEAHILDMPEKSLYNSVVEIFFFKRLRDEVKCNSPEELRQLILSDIKNVREFFRKNPRALKVGG